MSMRPALSVLSLTPIWRKYEKMQSQGGFLHQSSPRTKYAESACLILSCTSRSLTYSKVRPSPAARQASRSNINQNPRVSSPISHRKYRPKWKFYSCFQSWSLELLGLQGPKCACCVPANESSLRSAWTIRVRDDKGYCLHAPFIVLLKFRSRD